MRRASLLLIPLLAFSIARADEPKVVVKPDAFPTLVNPNCSHCVDEAKRRASELHEDDPVLAWTRGYSNGGAIPLRFFLAKHRVISDSYGVFVYDPDAGFARGFAPSYNFVFHGWRNGIMVIKDTKDGTLYSALSGVAFEGPRKGERLKPVPTLTTKWGWWLKHYPERRGVPHVREVQAGRVAEGGECRVGEDAPREDRSAAEGGRGGPGSVDGENSSDFPLSRRIATYGIIETLVEERSTIAVYEPTTNTVAAYRLVASATAEVQGPRTEQGRRFTARCRRGRSDRRAGAQAALDQVRIRGQFRRQPQAAKMPVLNTGTRPVFDVAGRRATAKLKGWTLEPLDCVSVQVVCLERGVSRDEDRPRQDVANRRNRRASPHPRRTTPSRRSPARPSSCDCCRSRSRNLKAVDAKARTVTLLMDGEKVAKVWPVEPDAEIKVMGWWGRLEQLKVGNRVWVWLKLNRQQQPVAVA